MSGAMTATASEVSTPACPANLDFFIFLPRRTYILFSEEKKTWRSQRTQNQFLWHSSSYAIQKEDGGALHLIYLFSYQKGFHDSWDSPEMASLSRKPGNYTL